MHNNLESFLQAHSKKVNVPLPSEVIGTFLFQLLSALRAIHSAGIIHGDLRPRNVLLNEDLCLKICNFRPPPVDFTAGYRSEKDGDLGTTIEEKCDCCTDSEKGSIFRYWAPEIVLKEIMHKSDSQDQGPSSNVGPGTPYNDVN